jgi:hypothetical protein
MKLNSGITLDSLHPAFRQDFERWATAVEKKFPQFEVRVTSARRTKEQQNALFKQNTPQRWVTNCDGYRAKSMHQYGLAVDIVLYRKYPSVKPAKLTGITWDSQEYRTVYAHVPPSDYGLELIPQELVHLQLRGSQAQVRGQGVLSAAYVQELGLKLS